MQRTIVTAIHAVSLLAFSGLGAALLDTLLSLACATGLMYLVPAAVGAGLGLVAAFGLGFVLLVAVPTNFAMTLVLGPSR